MSTVAHAQLQEQVWQELLALAAAALLREDPAAWPSPNPAPVAPAARAAPQPPAAPAAAGGHANPSANPGAVGWSGWGEGETGQQAGGAPLVPNPAVNPAVSTDSEQTAQGGTAARPAGPAAGFAAKEGAGVPRGARFGAFLRLFRRFAAWHRARAALQPLQRAEDTVSVRHSITSYSVCLPCGASLLSSSTKVT